MSRLVRVDLVHQVTPPDGKETLDPSFFLTVPALRAAKYGRQQPATPGRPPFVYKEVIPEDPAGRRLLHRAWAVKVILKPWSWILLGFF